jgi:hypothetical protein
MELNPTELPNWAWSSVVADGSLGSRVGSKREQLSQPHHT